MSRLGSRAAWVRLLPSIALLAVALIAFLLSSFGITSAIPLVPLILGIFAALIYGDVLLSEDVRKLDEKVDEKLAHQQGSLTSLSRSVEFWDSTLLRHFRETLDKTAELLDPANEDDYVKGWEGFTGTYQAFSPTYSAEDMLSIHSVIDKVYAPRFLNSKFKSALYLFFINGPEGEQSLQGFHTLMTEMCKKTGMDDPIRKLKIRVSTEEAPRYEFYVGQKEKTELAVVDFWLPAMLKSPGLPSYVFVLYNPLVLDELKRTFSRYWDRAVQVNTAAFLTPQFDVTKWQDK